MVNALICPLEAGDQKQAFQPDLKVPDKGLEKAPPFDRNQVHLLDGPFLDAQKLNRKYLMEQDVEWLLYPFRREAGLPITRKGNDSLIYAYTGSHLGHYLSACALAIRNTGDPELKARADAAVAVLAECQKRIGTGFVMGFPQSKMEAFIATGDTGRQSESKGNISVPWYALHKVYAGLLDMYLLTGNSQALEVVEKSVDWVWAQIGQLPEKKMQVLMRNEVGGMSEFFANLYAVTGRQEHLLFSQRFQENDLMEAIASGKDPLDNRHANSRIPRFVGSARQYEVTGDSAPLTLAERFWSFVFPDRSYVTGGNSAAEKFTPKAMLSKYIQNNTCETCNSYNMLKLTRILFSINPQAAYADYYERTLYNHIRASQHPKTGGVLVSHQLGTGRPNSDKWSVPNGEIVCCYGTGFENHTKYADSIYFHDGKDGVFVNLYISSELDWSEKGVRIKQETAYPEKPSSHFTIQCDKPQRFDLQFRRPWWATTGFEVSVNGVKQEIATTPGSYARIEREWSNGDKIEVSMPMNLHLEAFKDNPKRVALLYGPVVMAASTDSGNRFAAIVAEDQSFLQKLSPKNEGTLEFTAPASVFRTSPLDLKNEPVHFKPLTSFFEGPKALYWDMMSPKEFEGYQQKIRSEAERQKALEPVTADCVMFSLNRKNNEKDGKYSLQGLVYGLSGTERLAPRSIEQVSEEAHGMEFIDPSGRWYPEFDVFTDGIICTFRYIHDRTASFQMSVLPDQKQAVQVRVWRPLYNTAGGKWTSKGAFEVLVEGTVIGTATVESIPHDQFTDRSFSIPPELIAGKKTAKVSLRSVPGGEMAPLGFYECRIVSEKAPH